jgi:glycosyltransferase involved in cell wall biosynthesis
MHASIDCRYIRERPSGIGAYVQALVDRLPALAPDDRFHLWVSPLANRPLSPCANVVEQEVAAGANSLSTLLSPSGIADLNDVSVLHAPFNILGRGVKCATVVTIHDILWLMHPGWCEGVNLTTPFAYLFYRDGIMRAVNKASRIVSISHATADTLYQRWPHLKDRIRVIHHGIEPRFVPPASRDDARSRARELIGIDRDYLFVMGQNSPSKNHAAVLQAFADADLGDKVHLVLLQRLYQQGRFGLSRKQALYPLAEKLGLLDRVHWMSGVDDDEVVTLLQGAMALIQFSRFEGFGMPALEAAACGTPVIASDIAPLVEVLDGAGINVPLTVSDLSAAIKQVGTEPSLRDELSQKGVERSRAFRWDTCAAEHLELYREAEAAGPR